MKESRLKRIISRVYTGVNDKLLTKEEFERAEKALRAEFNKKQK